MHVLIIRTEYHKVITLDDFNEIRDSYIEAEICDALSNTIRVEILSVLREKREISIGDLLRYLEKKGLKLTHAGIRMHIPKLVFTGLVEMIKIDGKDGLKLKKDVRIFVKEVEENG